MAKDREFTSYAGESEQERKLRLQEKNRKAQQAFRSRQKGKISELSDQCRLLEAKQAKTDARLRELQHDNGILQRALLHQTQELKRFSLEYAHVCGQHTEHVYVPRAAHKFDPSEDIVLKFPVTVQAGKTEHLLIRSSEISEGSGIDKIADLFGETWMPQLVNLHSELQQVQQRAKGGEGEGRGPTTEETAAALDDVAARVKLIQRDMFECFVKAFRAQPIKSRVVATDILFNCHAALDHAESMQLADKVVTGMELSEKEKQESCQHYEKYLCEMTLLQVQRTKLLEQLRECYSCTEEARMQKLTRETMQMKEFLAASAAVEALQLLLRKENELYCDLLQVVAMEAWEPLSFLKHMVLSSPGMADFLACLEVIRWHVQPNRSPKQITLEFLQKAIGAGGHGEDMKLDLDFAGKLQASGDMDLRGVSPRDLDGAAALGGSRPILPMPLLPNQPLSPHDISHLDPNAHMPLNPAAAATLPLDIGSWELDPVKANLISPRTLDASALLPSPRTLASPRSASRRLSSPRKALGRGARHAAASDGGAHTPAGRKVRDAVDSASKLDDGGGGGSVTKSKRKRSHTDSDRSAKQAALDQLEQNRLTNSAQQLPSWGSGDAVKRAHDALNDGPWRSGPGLSQGISHPSSVLEAELSKAPGLPGWSSALADPTMRARLSLSQMLRAGDPHPGAMSSNDLAHHLMSMPDFRERSLSQLLSPDMLQGNNLSNLGLDLVRNHTGRARMDSLTQLLAVAEDSGLANNVKRSSLNGSMNQQLLNLGTAAALQHLIPNNNNTRQDTLTCLSDMLDTQAAGGGGARAFLPNNLQQGLRGAGNWGQRKTPAQLHQEYTTFLGEDDLQRPGLIQRM